MEPLRSAILADWPHTAGYASAIALLSALDVVMGVIVAFIAKQVSSTVSRTGMARKCAVAVLIAGCIIFDTVLPPFPVPKLSLGGSFIFEGPTTFAALVSLAFCITEVISLMEKCVLLGLPVPKGLKAALKKARAAFDGPEAMGASQDGK